MSTPPAAEAAVASSTQSSLDPCDVAQPLSAFVQGVLTVHFDQGAVATRRTAQMDARAFLEKQTGSENTDSVTWHAEHWFTWANERMVFSSFDADRDQNWEVTPNDRGRLSEAGHERGVIGSLLRLWERRGRGDEPSYSIRAVVSLHQFALDGADRATWEIAARTFEGAHGAVQIAKAWKDQTRPDKANDARQGAEADESAPEAPDQPGHGVPRLDDLDIAEPPATAVPEDVAEAERPSDADPD